MENILINVDSKFRNIHKYPNPGKFTFILDEPLKNISYIRLSSIELPTTFYTFTSGLNNISFAIIDSNDNQTYIYIKEGNYNSSQMVTYIQAQLNDANNAYGTHFKIAWDDIDYKVTFSNDTPFSLIFNNDELHRSLGDRLGFRGTNTDYLKENQLISYDDFSNTYMYSWTADTFLDITKDEYIFLKINDYGVIYNNTNTKNLLAKIILYDQQFVIDNGANFLTKEYIFKQPTNISKFDIELVNSLGNTIDMNLINFSMTLECGQNYDINSYNKHNFVLKK